MYLSLNEKQTMKHFTFLTFQAFFPLMAEKKISDVTLYKLTPLNGPNTEFIPKSFSAQAPNSPIMVLDGLILIPSGHV